MDLKSIQDKLNSEFTGSDRKLVFWYDDNTEFAEEIDSIKLENAKLYRLEKDNLFYTKYFLEVVDKATNYLVYAPFPKPADKDNHLADIVYYSRLFYADKISLVCVDLNIPDKFKDHFKQYQKFWNANERIDKFAALGIESFNDEIIDIGLLAVLAGVKTPSFDEILKSLVISGSLTDNKSIAAFDKMGLLPAFWQFCNKYYGYTGDNPTLEKLVVTLLITYTAHSWSGEFPKPWQSFLSPKKNDAAVFVSNLMNNILCKDAFDEIAAHMAIKLKAAEILKNVPVENYFNCDTFEVFDKYIIEHLAGLIVNNNAPLPSSFATMLTERSLKKHFASKYADYYNAIAHADSLIKLVDKFDPSGIKDAVQAIKAYTSDWFRIDECYRHYYTAFDRLEATDILSRLRVLVENVYTNGYLAKISMLWAEKIENIRSFDDISCPKQIVFYKAIVEPLAKKETTVVIISDAFRFECAAQLNNEFVGKAKFTSELSCMMATLPSYTRLGMAALLPHKKLSFSENFEVLVDDKPCASSEQRADILQSSNLDSAVSTYTEVMAMSRDEIRQTLAGKKVIYIYHNQIDARGDNASTENEVFTACDEAINEITAMIKRLTVHLSFTNYIITADHGFIYKRDKLDESDKVTLPKYKNSYQNKRFILSRENVPAPGTLGYSLDYLGENNVDVFVTVPRGVDIFKVTGGGQNYVHGGASLQELIVPVIRVKTIKGKKETGNVEVILTSLPRKITNLITYLDFMQNENVTDVLLPSELKVYFESEADEKVSGETLIIANKKDTPPEQRMFREKITLRDRKYLKSDKYFLVMKDANSDMEVARYEFTIDIAFADDFGFNV